MSEKEPEFVKEICTELDAIKKHCRQVVADSQQMTASQDRTTKAWFALRDAVAECARIMAVQAEAVERAARKCEEARDTTNASAKTMAIVVRDMEPPVQELDPTVGYVQENSLEIAWCCAELHRIHQDAWMGLDDIKLFIQTVETVLDHTIVLYENLDLIGAKFPDVAELVRDTRGRTERQEELLTIMLEVIDPDRIWRVRE